HCARNEFKNLDRYTEALSQRYGEANSAEEYAQKAQMLNYELMRPMFEAFSVNRYKATGVIQWMLNSAWPEMYWQLYDYYLMPNGAFYATKKAGEPLQAMYNYADKSIYLVNDKLQDENEITVAVNILDINSKMIFTKEIKTDAKSNSSIKILTIPEFKNISSTYFLDLRISKGDKELTNNFYWLSTKEDILDYDFEFENWYYHTPSKQYADYSALNTMKKTEVKYSLTSNKGTNSTEYKIQLNNESPSIAFFMELQLVDSKTSELILPVIFSDNYVSLLPNEKRTISANVDSKYLVNKEVELRVKGINLKN
ncbi:MAG: glycoside hydrolase family 2, partial [Bacteroidetes bacterium]